MNKFREERIAFLTKHPLDAQTVEGMLHALEMFFATGRFLHTRSTIEDAQRIIIRAETIARKYWDLEREVN